MSCDCFVQFLAHMYINKPKAFAYSIYVPTLNKGGYIIRRENSNYLQGGGM